MIHNFMLFSDLQKRVSTSPIKTWRLLKQMRDDGRMKVDQDWQMLDRKLFVNVPRFIAELEGLGYENMKSDDFNNADVKSDEIKKLADEIRLISDEITERNIQEEMKSSDIINHEIPPNMISPEITAENDKPQKVHDISTMKSGDINLRFEEFKLISDEIMRSELMKSKDTIIGSKDEVIKELKRNVDSKEKDNAQLHDVISTLTKQNETLTKQNAWLTNLITAPKDSRSSARSDSKDYDARGNGGEAREHIEIDPEHDTEDSAPEDNTDVDRETTHANTSDLYSSPADRAQSTQETASTIDPQLDHK
jgi:hypothetical protein